MGAYNPESSDKHFYQQLRFQRITWSYGRPVVQEDGGDIKYHGFDYDSGEVLLQLQASREEYGYACLGYSSACLLFAVPQWHRRGCYGALITCCPEIGYVLLLANRCDTPVAIECDRNDSL